MDDWFWEGNVVLRLVTYQISKWYGTLLLTAMWRQSDHPHTAVGIALPHFPEYMRLLERTAVSLKKLNLSVFIVHENGQIEVKT